MPTFLRRWLLRLLLRLLQGTDDFALPLYVQVVVSRETGKVVVVNVYARQKSADRDHDFVSRKGRRYASRIFVRPVLVSSIRKELE